MTLIRHHVQKSLDFPLEEGQLLVLEPAGQKELEPEVFFSFKEKLASKGYSLLYIPYIANALSIDTIKYYVPGYGGNPSIDEIQSRVGATLGLDIHSPLVIKRKKGNLTVIESDKPGVTTESLLSSLAEELPQNNVHNSLLDDVIFSAAGVASRVHCLINRKDETQENIHLEKTSTSSCDYCELGDLTEGDELLHFILTKNVEELREFGMSEKLIQALFELKDPKLSRIRINRYGKIILEDYNNEEIQMDTKTKTLYFLYLRHPEGIVIKDLPQYEEEAFDLYQSISKRDDIKSQRSTIQNLLDPYKGDVHACLSRIKRAFLHKMSELKAKNYYVDGPRAEKRTISLNRDMVIWETIR